MATGVRSGRRARQNEAKRSARYITASALMVELSLRDRRQGYSSSVLASTRAGCCGLELRGGSDCADEAPRIDGRVTPLSRLSVKS
jgi:hypothetical protein